MAERLLITFRRGALAAIDKMARSEHAQRCVRRTLMELRAAWPDLPRSGDVSYLIPPTLRAWAAPVRETGYWLIYVPRTTDVMVCGCMVDSGRT